MPRTKIAGFLHTFTDGVLLLVREDQIPFSKQPKKVLADFEAEFYIGSTSYDTIVEVRVDSSLDVDIFQGLDRKLVTILGEVEARPSRGIEQPWVIAESIARYGNIVDRAYQIHLSGRGGSAQEDWLRAEDELLAENAPARGGASSEQAVESS